MMLVELCERVWALFPGLAEVAVILVCDVGVMLEIYGLAGTMKACILYRDDDFMSRTSTSCIGDAMRW